ncbi:MAG: hypothetical protein FD171_546 [Actinobacteria bacterium]|nr:MAG: hypothetical protein FD171_546 [Actinomycetota bacterium]
MPKAAYCSECAGYVWIGKDGGCVNGHARSCLRREYDALQDPADGKPAPSVPRSTEPRTPTVRHAAEVLGAGAVSLAAAAADRAMTAGMTLALTAGEGMQRVAERLAAPPAGASLPELVAERAPETLSQPTPAAHPQVDGHDGLARDEVAAAETTALPVDPGSAASGGAPQTAKHLAGLTKWLRVLLAAYAAAALLVVFQDILVSVALAVRPASATSLAANLSLAYLQDALWWVTGVVFLMWIYRANKNLHSLSALPMSFTPAWSIGWYLVPVAMFFMPYQSMREIWQVSHSGRSSSHGVLGWWWGLWLAMVLLGSLATRSLALVTDVAGLQAWMALDTTADALKVAAGIVAFTMVSRIGAAYTLSFGETA